MMTEPGEAPEKPGSTCVPASALAIDGTEPAEGDEVEFMATGRVERSDGGNAYVRILTVNGEPVPDHESTESTETEATEEAARADAQRMDASGYMR